MNTYTFAQISVGMQASFIKKITEEDMQRFLAITEDTNPLHTQKEFAQKQKFPEKVVYGMLTASLLSTLAGVHLPGLNSLILSVSIQFQKPVFVEETVTIEGTVTDKKEFGNIITISFVIKKENQNQEKVSTGTMLIRVLA